MLPRSRTLLLAFALCLPWHAHAADVKSAKICNEELRENAAAIKASGISLRDFIHQCWRSKPGAPTPLEAQTSKPSRIADNAKPAMPKPDTPKPDTPKPAMPSKPTRKAAADVPADQRRAQPVGQPAEIARSAQRTEHASLSNETGATPARLTRPPTKVAPRVAKLAPYLEMPSQRLARFAPPHLRSARYSHDTAHWRTKIWRAATWRGRSAHRQTRVAARSEPAYVILARSELGTLWVSGSGDTLAAGGFRVLCLDSTVVRTSTCLSGQTGAVTTKPLDKTAHHRRTERTPAREPPGDPTQEVMLLL